MKRTLCFSLSLLITSFSFAIPPGQWQCIAFDAKERDFPATATSMQGAINAATVACKRSSSQPGTCKSAQSFCEQGPLSLIEDRCLVTDDNGHSWDTTGQDSCKSAMSMCNQWQYLHGTPRGQCSVKHGG
jgi:hypothetical protein